MLWWLIPGLVTVEIAIVMLDALVTELGWVPIGAARRLFNITREDGVANFFSSFQMLAVALLQYSAVWQFVPFSFTARFVI